MYGCFKFAPTLVSRLIPTPPPIDGVRGAHICFLGIGNRGVSQTIVPMSIIGRGATSSGWGLVVLTGNAWFLFIMPSLMFTSDVLVVAVKVLVVSLAQL